MRLGHFNPVSGAAGDMVVGAFLDAGLPLERLRAALAPLPLKGYELVAEKAKRGGLVGTRFQVVASSPQPHLRTLREVLALVEATPLPPERKAKALAIFCRLGEAEAKVHDVPLEQVEFHEVGAIDALIEITGACLAVAEMGLQALTCSPLNVGGGRVATHSGLLPVPPPAVAELLARSGAPFRPGYGDEGELLTPTGAAILTSLASFTRPYLKVEAIGYGLGSRENPRGPNALPLYIGQALSPVGERELVLLETNIDDASPQLLGYVMDKLFEAGALDVWFTPIYMKKNRPATKLSALLPPEVLGVAGETLARESTTLGWRLTSVARQEAEREVVEFTSSLGRVRVKVKRWGGGVVGVSPEYEDCRRLAQSLGLPLQEVFQRVLGEARQGLGAP